MSKLLPITHFIDYVHFNDRTRPYIMAEFAANGEKNLVLTHGLVREVMRSPEFANVLRKDIKSAGVKFVDAHAPYGTLEDLNLPFEDLRPTMLMRFKLALQIAADFGIDSIACHGGGTPEEFSDYSLDHLQTCVIRSLEELLPTAERLGIVIAVENGWTATATPERLLAVLNHFNSDTLGLCYDSGHANVMAKNRGATESNAIKTWERFGEIPYDSKILEKMQPHVTTCHLHDNNGLTDQHYLPGKGNVDWPHIIGLLKTAPRLKYFQNEVPLIYKGASVVEVCRTFRELIRGK